MEWNVFHFPPVISHLNVKLFTHPSLVADVVIIFTG